MRRFGWRAWARAAVVACLVVGTVTTGAARGAAQAGPPTLTVEPATFDTAKGEVEVAYVDIPVTEGTYVAQCATTVVDGSGADPAQWCRTMSEVSERSGTISGTVYAGFRSFGGPLVVCADVPGGCVVAVGAAEPVRVDAFVRIEFTSPVDVTVTPSEGVAAGQELDVAVTGLDPGAAYGLHFCRDFLWDAAFCLEAPAVEVVASASGTARATVVAPMEIARNSASCAVLPCGVGVVTDTSILAGMGTYAATDASVTVTPNEGITLGQSVQVDLADLAPGRSYTLRSCIGSAGANALLADQCSSSPDDPSVVAGADGTATATMEPAWSVETSSGTGPCQLWVCAVGAVLEGTDWVVGTGPFARARATATLTPDTGLVDRQEVTVTASGLRPGGNFHLRLCPMSAVLSLLDLTGCELRASDPALVARADGTAEATIAVAQRIGWDAGQRGSVCRDEPCAVAIVDDHLYFSLPLIAAGTPYAMAQARLSATPDTGLADGDVVTLTGVDVMASYAGAPHWIFPTGVWGVGQCAAAVVDDPSIVGVFRHCAPVPSAGLLDVPGSTFEADVTVRAQVDAILGEPIDCTTGPGACVLALTRVESDGGVTVHTVPITLG